MSNVVSLRRVPNVPEPERVSAAVVAGSGGAATTTTAYGLATALRLGTGKEVSAVDATSDGGNLLSRTGFEGVDPARSIRQFESRMALTSAGVVVVGGSDGQPSDPAIVDELLAARHSARIHDVGTALRSPRLAPLIRSGAALVMVAPARSEPLSRMRDALTWIMSTYGAQTLGDAIIVVSHQLPDAPVDLAPIRDALAPRVAGFVEVPFDPALAQPGVLDHRRLTPATLDAWAGALDVLGGLLSRSEPGTKTGSELA
ncbi:hypothetical protein EGT67_19125 [Prescottella agglutinans]|uniref:MinD-like ATPase involved in chromosome partitioning or flagellar assembly n=1 Tax=Prescottella agglutinans TaxID=1644129 RepID=A0A3S3AH36_9NOCA|nr:hypothetical protein [Prescottella agglutinans]RVW08037.1 hypothetical protein EGT67_19125 [Prescottella agglutinans]